MSTPTPPAPRHESLDVLRGIAILGTLATNIWIFTSPGGLFGYLVGPPSAAVPAGWAELKAVLQQSSQGKFLGLLTLLFGIGLEIQRRSAVRAGRRWPGRYPWRAGLLLLDGALHFLLVAEFDVLMGYAVTGVVVAYLLATSERSQRVWLVLAAAAHVLLLTLVTAVVLLVPPVAPAAGEAPRPNPYADGSFADLVAFRLDNLVLFRIEPVFIGALSVAMFLAGARLLRAGVLEPGGYRLRARLMLVGVVALGIDLVLGLAGEAVLPGTDGATGGFLLARYGTASVVAFGLLALVTQVVLARPRAGFVRRRLADVGRMALSCYVLQNVAASALCYGWGLGLAARLTPAQQVPGTVAIYAVVAVVITATATLWLSRFARGPVELAWQWCFDRLDRAIPDRRAGVRAGTGPSWGPGPRWTR